MPTKKEAAHDDLVQETRRLTAQEIFHAAVENAREELKRSARTLAFSGIAWASPWGLPD